MWRTHRANEEGDRTKKMTYPRVKTQNVTTTMSHKVTNNKNHRILLKTCPYQSKNTCTHSVRYNAGRRSKSQNERNISLAD